MSRLVRAVAALIVIATFVVGPGLPTADAQLTGGCTATINGLDVGAAKSISTAIAVGETDTITVVGVAPGPITGYKLFVTLGPFRIPATDGTVSSGETTYKASIKVSDYAKYGVGFYQVDGDTTGTACSVWAYVKVTGPSPFSTIAGIIAMIFIVLGLLGMFLSFARAKP